MAYEKNVSVLQNNNLSLSGSVVTVTGSLYGSFMSGTVSEFTTVTASNLVAGGVKYPTTDGTDGQILVTDGAGELSFQDIDVTIRVKNLEATQIDKGTPLYVTASGTGGNIAGVYIADAGNASRMPAACVAGEDISAGAEGVAYLSGFISGVNTSTFDSGDEVYVAVGGGYTNVRPTGSAKVQPLGYVEKSDANGSGVIQGPGHFWELPNITAGHFWVGASNGVPTTVASSSFAKLADDNIFTGTNTFQDITADTITAREYHTELVSASIIYQSGSTKFGDTSDDTHQFTGSVLVNGSVTVDTLKSSTATISLYTASPSDTINIGRASLGTSINLKSNDVVVEKDLAVNGGDLTSTSTTFNLLNSGVSTINFGGGASSMYIGSAASTMAIGHASGTGTTNIRNALTTNGNVTLGNDASDTTTVNGPLAANGGSMSTNDGTFNLLTTTATTINFGSAAVSMNIGSSTGTTNINNRLVVDGSAAGDSTIAGNLAVDTSTLYVDSSSNEVGIGTTSPNAKLDVNGNAVVSGSLTVTGTVTELSTKRIKKNIRSMKSQLDTISKLNPVTYYRRDTEEKTKEYGFISEEVKEVYPEFVKNEGVNYSKMVSVLVSAVKELKDKVEEQQKEIEELKKGSSSNKIVTLGS